MATMIEENGPSSHVCVCFNIQVIIIYLFEPYHES